jgi:hypothetical protein
MPLFGQIVVRHSKRCRTWPRSQNDNARPRAIEGTRAGPQGLPFISIHPVAECGNWMGCPCDHSGMAARRCSRASPRRIRYNCRSAVRFTAVIAREQRWKFRSKGPYGGATIRRVPRRREPSLSCSLSHCPSVILHSCVA